jgi:hypothetical protein
MGAASQKARLMCGLTHSKAKKKFLEIFAKAQPGVKFGQRYPGVWVWMEAWFRLRAHNESFDVIAQAFAEKIARMHKQNHELSETIHLQRLEIKKRLNEIDSLKARIADKEKAEAAG